MLSTLVARKGPTAAFSNLRSIVLVRKASTVPAKQDEASTEVVHPYEDVFPKSRQPALSLEEKMKYWKEANEVFYGPQRDMKNFPPLEMPDRIEKDYNFFIIPTSFFKQLYPRLGVSGCYSLVWLTFLFTLNKEWVVPDGAVGEVFGWMVFVGIVVTKWGDKIGAALDKKSDIALDFHYTQPLKEAKARYSEEIETLKTDIDNQSAVPVIFEAKKEQLDLQLEIQYRERLANVYNEVKSRLDYQSAVETAQRKFEQDLMINWIVNSVEKSITPQQEKESIASCIANLKTISQTAAL